MSDGGIFFANTARISTSTCPKLFQRVWLAKRRRTNRSKWIAAWDLVHLAIQALNWLQIANPSSPKSDHYHKMPLVRSWMPAYSPKRYTSSTFKNQAQRTAKKKSTTVIIRNARAAQILVLIALTKSLFVRACLSSISRIAAEKASTVSSQKVRLGSLMKPQVTHSSSSVGQASPRCCSMRMRREGGSGC
ncbi:hypothetical protein BT63DRAFT_466116 [Microthyrium microscopicum]|uniref:Uncharacterized protein n=1 Tax=Microthyrium microscopicum TaxID=703497 RepID=A0A6A6UN98_9PEZI|nr:hypothetical protein BT63DRAFT_466116 [Microthyrium microscopicum]